MKNKIVVVIIIAICVLAKAAVLDTESARLADNCTLRKASFAQAEYQNALIGRAVEYMAAMPERVSLLDLETYRKLFDIGISNMPSMFQMGYQAMLVQLEKFFLERKLFKESEVNLLVPHFETIVLQVIEERERIMEVIQEEAEVQMRIEKEKKEVMRIKIIEKVRLRVRKFSGYKSELILLSNKIAALTQSSTGELPQADKINLVSYLKTLCNSDDDVAEYIMELLDKQSYKELDAIMTQLFLEYRIFESLDELFVSRLHKIYVTIFEHTEGFRGNRAEFIEAREQIAAQLEAPDKELLREEALKMISFFPIAANMHGVYAPSSEGYGNVLEDLEKMFLCFGEMVGSGVEFMGVGHKSPHAREIAAAL